MKHPTIFKFLVVFLTITGFFLSEQVPLTSASEDVIETVVWEYGEKGAVHGYIRASLLSDVNASAYSIEMDEYDLLGDLTGHSDNRSGGFLWKSPTDIEFIKSDGGYTENLTIAGKNITVVVLEFVYDQQLTLYKYMESSGVLALSLSESDNEEYSEIISWVDLDVNAHAEELNQFITAYPFWGILLSLFGVKILARKKTRTH